MEIVTAQKACRLGGLSNMRDRGMLNRLCLNDCYTFKRCTKCRRKKGERGRGRGRGEGSGGCSGCEPLFPPRLPRRPSVSTPRPSGWAWLGRCPRRGRLLCRAAPHRCSRAARNKIYEPSGARSSAKPDSENRHASYQTAKFSESRMGARGLPSLPPAAPATAGRSSKLVCCA